MRAETSGAHLSAYGRRRKLLYIMSERSHLSPAALPLKTRNALLPALEQARGTSGPQAAKAEAAREGNQLSEAEPQTPREGALRLKPEHFSRLERPQHHPADAALVFGVDAAVLLPGRARSALWVPDPDQ